MLKKEIQNYSKNGFCVVRNFFPKSTIKKLNGKIDYFFKSKSKNLNGKNINFSKISLLEQPADSI